MWERQSARKLKAALAVGKVCRGRRLWKGWESMVCWTGHGGNAGSDQHGNVGASAVSAAGMVQCGAVAMS